jgi:hypothetical protein
MTDRELVERAARAIGLGVTWEPVHNCHWISFDQGIPVRPWVPLNDDAEAFRLAVRLNIHHGREGNTYWARWAGSSDVYREELGKDGVNDPFAATRRAIVRAAAARLVSGSSPQI